MRRGSLLFVVFVAVLNGIIITVNGQAPVVTITLTDPNTFMKWYIRATKDQDIVMDCYVENLPPETTVRWQRAYRLKNGTAKILALSQDMALEDNIHYSIERPTQFTWRLRIRNIQVTDEGMYQCYVLTNQNSKAEDRRIISVVYRPYLDLQRTSSDMSVDADEPVELICNATARPPATIEWTRLGGALLPIGQEKKQGSLLKIDHIQPDDRGIYRCTAVNSVGSTVTDINVNVRFEPIVKVNEKVVYQAVGYRIELQCFGEGNPVPTRKESYWTRSGVPLPSSSDEFEERFIEGAFGQVTYELILLDVQESLYGTYTCHIVNMKGTGMNSITLERAETPQKSIKLGRVIAASSTHSLSVMLCSVAVVLSIIVGSLSR